MWGMVTLVCLDMIFLFSTQAVRNKAYNFFLSTHIIGFIFVLPAVRLSLSILIVQKIITYPICL